MDLIINWIQDYDLFLNALIASLLISFASAPIGVFLNLKRMTLMGEAISHSLLPGFALAFMLYGMSYLGLILGGLFAGLLVLGLMMGLNRFVTIKEDGILTIVYLTFSAFGILIVLKSGIKIDLSHILIGNILLIDQVWLAILLVSSLSIRFIFSRIRKKLLIVLMDPEYAQFLGIPTQRIKSIFYFLVLWILVLCFYSVGTLLSLGLLMIPALLAKVAVKSLDKQIHWGWIFGILMSVLGLAASIGLDWPTGPTMILAGGVLFIIMILVRPSAGKFLIFALLFLFYKSPTHAAFLSQLRPKDQILISNSYLKLFFNQLLNSKNEMPVQILIPHDQSVHNYQLKPSDLKKIKRAKTFIYIGNGVEDALKEQVVAVSSDLTPINLAEKVKLPSGHNEHFWLNPEYAEVILDALKNVIVNENPKSKDHLEEAFRKFQLSLADAKAVWQEKFRPYKGRSLLISHNSLYFVNDLLGIDAHFYKDSTSPSDVINLKRIIKNRKTPIVKENGNVNFLFESLIKEQNRSYAGEIYGENVPSEYFEKHTYLFLLNKNIETILHVYGSNN